MKYLELLSLILVLVCIYNVKSLDYSNRCNNLDSLKYVQLNSSAGMYKCFRSEIQEAAGSDGKWKMPDDHCPGPALDNFVQVVNAFLSAPKKRFGEIVHTNSCAKECLKRLNCLSFEMQSEKCFLSEYGLSDNYILTYKKQSFFYKRIYPNQEFIPVDNATIPGRDNLGRTNVKTVAECQEKCRNNPTCMSFEVKLTCKRCRRFFCDRTNIHFQKYKMYINPYGWSIYLRNPNYKKNCSKPDPVKYANLNVFDTNVDSMATYKCLHSKHVSEKESEYCTDPLIYSCDKLMRCTAFIGSVELWICPKVLKKKHVSIYCDGIETLDPKEYITLKKPTYFEVPLIKSVQSCPGIGANGRMRYERVRFLTEKMALDFSDKKFAVFEPLPPAEKKHASRQNITIDLRGTPFAIDKKANWTASGVSNIVSTQITEEDQLAVIICSGSCGMCKSINPFPVIHRAQNPEGSELWCKIFFPDPMD